MRFAKLFSASSITTGLVLAGAAHAETADELARQLRDSENAFAATMAQRDRAAEKMQGTGRSG